jgi:hypothetical protein
MLSSIVFIPKAMALKTKKNRRTEVHKVDDVSERDFISRSLHKIEAAEEDFALRKFQSSLRLSNEILSSKNTTHCNICSKDIRVVSVPSPLFQGSKYMHVRFSFNLGEESEYLQIQNRSCAIALQSSYELWKRRVSNHIKIDQELLCDVTRALDFLMNSNEDQNSTSLVQFDLISIYVDFCHAIGVSIPLIPSILELLVHFIDMSNQDRIKSCLDETLYNGCYSLLHLLLVQILPFIHDQKAIDLTMESVKMILQYGEVSLIDHMVDHCATGIIMRNEPVQSTLQTIHNSLTGLLLLSSSNVPNNSDEEASVRALREILSDLKTIMDETISTSSPGLSTILDETSDRLSKQINSRFDDINQYENDDHRALSLKDIIHSTIYDVWESDNRWLHRAKFLGGGLVVFTFWKQRRSVIKSGRYLAKALTSPLREFAAAFKPP